MAKGLGARHLMPAQKWRRRGRERAIQGIAPSSSLGMGSKKQDGLRTGGICQKFGMRYSPGVLDLVESGSRPIASLEPPPSKPPESDELNASKETLRFPGWRM